jgi:hypothetical protein
MAINVDVVPIRGTKYIGAAKIATPRKPPRYKYHSESPGRLPKSDVEGKKKMRVTSTATLTNVKTRTEPKLPVRWPKLEFKTL